MGDQFDQYIPNDILIISNFFSTHNYELQIVGGAVRDSLRNVSVTDFDLATSASPKQVQQLFQNRPDIYIIPTGLVHGTITLVLNKVHYEITTYRIDGEYSNKRHPDSVKFTSSLEEDLARRDFTINAIAVDPQTKKIYDPFFGQLDIKQGIIRCVGDPMQRFQEDALRMLRACRFASVLEYKIDIETYSAIKKLAPNIQSISQERIRDEFIKILKSNKPSVGINLVCELGLLIYIIPELIEGLDVEQNEFHKYDVYTHNIKTCDYMKSDDPICRLAALLHDVGKPRAKNFALKIGNGNVFYNHEVIGAKMTFHIMKRLKFSKEETHKAVLLVELHMFYYTRDWTDGAIRRFLRRFDGNTVFLGELFQLRKADRTGSGTKKSNPFVLQEFKNRIKHILELDAALKISDLNINGNDLMKIFSLNPGPIIGHILNHLLELVLDDPNLNTFDNLKEASLIYIQKCQVCDSRYLK